MFRVLTIVGILILTNLATGSEPRGLLENGSFESNLQDQWAPFWSRDGHGQADRCTDPVHTGTYAVHVRYDGTRDWSFSYAQPIAVEPGQIYELTGWVRTARSGPATLGVILYDRRHHALSWTFGGKTVHDSVDWRHVTCRFLIPEEGKSIVPRLIGDGSCEAWLDDVALRLVGNVEQLRTDLPAGELRLQNSTITLKFSPSAGTFTLTDRRSGKVYRQHDMVMSHLVVLAARKSEQRIDFDLLKPDDMLTVHATLALNGDTPECLLTLRADADGSMTSPLAFPAPWQTAAGDYLIMPVNEGISYPVDDATLPSMRYHMFGGHGLCMGFWGITNLKSGIMAIVETPDDAVADVPRLEKHLCIAPQWLPQKTAFGPARRMRFIVLEAGGYVAMCKRYRRYAQQIGRFKTLADKRVENPYVDRLVGAANVWNWDKQPAAMCRELQAAGIKRILWSHRADPDQIAQMNSMGVLTSRYDIYQDVMNPANFPKLRGQHADWPTAAWPDDIIIGKDGEWTKGWRVRGKDGNWYPCGVLCDRMAVNYAKQRIPKELETHAYHCRFIDTTTAAAWRECYSPDHPQTRTDSRINRMRLLDYVSGPCHLVAGSETGHDAAVPYVHYFEGMLSLGPYRVPDAGRSMMQTVTEVPARVAKFQTGHYYRLPLWELVYHDCVVAQWYWGDYNNKLPALWERRDLFNALYGTPPMFMFTRATWQQQRQRFVQSYRVATPVARATGYSEMISHRWLTPDHTVQQTAFANGVVVTVNFGTRNYPLEDGTVVKPMGHHVQGMSQ